MEIKPSVDDESEFPMIYIIVLIIILMGLNFFMFLIYRGANPTQNLWTQLWIYFDSNIFKIITVSIILPIILFLLEGHFKFLDTIKKNRLERVRKAEENRRVNRLDGIKSVIQMWTELYGLIADIIYLNTDNKKKEKIQVIQKKLYNFISSANNTLIIWDSRFHLPKNPDINNIYRDAAGLFFEYADILFCSAKSVAYLIGESNNKSDCEELQHSLSLIQITIESIVYQPIIKALQNFMKLAEYYEGQDSDDLRMKEIQRETLEDVNYLKESVKPIKKLEMEDIDILHFVKGSEVENFRKEANKVKKWMRRNDYELLSKYKDFEKFQDSFKKIPHDKLIQGVSTHYPKEYIEHLANHLYFISTCDDLRRTVNLLKDD